MDSLRKVFASRLREFRGPRTQSEFAEYLDLSLRTYQELEAGNIPQAKTLNKIVDRLGIETETILFFDRDLVTKPSPQDALQVLANLVNSKPSAAALPGTEDFDDQEIRMLQAAVDAIRSQREPSSTRKKRENHGG